MWDHLIKDWQKITLNDDGQEHDEDLLERLDPFPATLASSHDIEGQRLRPAESPSSLQLHSPFSENIWSPWSPLSSPNSLCTGSQTSLTPPSPSFDALPYTQKGGSTLPPPAMYDWFSQGSKVTPLSSASKHGPHDGFLKTQPLDSSKKPEVFGLKDHQTWTFPQKQISVPPTPSLSPGSYGSNSNSDTSPFSPFSQTFRPNSFDGGDLLATSSEESVLLNGIRSFSKSAEHKTPTFQNLPSPVSQDRGRTGRSPGSSSKNRSSTPASLGPSLNNHKMELFKTELCRNWEEKGYCEYNIRCQYAHGEAELRYVERDPRWKTKPCKAFFETGSCSYAKRCCFRHDLGDQAANASSTALTRKPLLQRVGLLPETEVRGRAEQSRGRPRPSSSLPIPRQYPHSSDSGNVLSS